MRPAAAAPGSVRRVTAPRFEAGDDALEPLTRSLAQPLSQPASAIAPGPSLTSASAGRPPNVGELAAIEEVVRRIAWGGDRRRGVARIELGGEHHGTAIVVRGEGRTLELSFEVARGGDANSLSERLVERLRARGLDVSRVDVR